MKPWTRRIASVVLPRSVSRSIRKPYYLWQQWRGAGLEPEMAWLASFAHPGDTVLDIGANVGFYTTRLARLVTRTGRVLAFEPVPDTLEILRYLVARLGLPQVSLYGEAIADREGEAEFSVPEEAPGVYNFYLAHLGRDTSSGAETFRVLLVTLDGLRARGLGRVSFVKCDVEGAEGRVLRGGEAFLRQDSPVLLLEISEMSRRMGDSPADTFDFLGRLEYRGYYVAGRSWVPVSGPVEGVVNYFFLPPSLPVPPGA
jgi:FkbM family methyltransferase